MYSFDTLAAGELRMKVVRARRAGVTHAQARRPRGPLPGQVVSE